MNNLMPKPLFKIGRATLQGIMWFVWIVRLALLAGVLFVLVAVFSFLWRADKTPSVEDAPYSVVAVINGEGNDAPLTHVYYAGQVMDNGSQYILVDCWQFDGKGYNLKKDQKILVKKDWSRIGIYRRE